MGERSGLALSEAEEGGEGFAVRMRTWLVLLAVVLSSSALAAYVVLADDRRASQASPRNGVDQNRSYLFYLHGAWLETHGLDQPHPIHGRYEYRAIVRELTDRGFEVVSEVRQGDAHPLEYARRIADRIRGLVEDGISPRRIAVAGHSKGGQMALIVASLVREDDVSYVVLAGCGKPGAMFRRSYERFLQGHAKQLRGRILSIYDSADQEAGSCREAFDQASGLEYDEVILHTGRGHGLFYSPNPVWIDKVVEWIQ